MLNRFPRLSFLLAIFAGLGCGGGHGIDAPWPAKAGNPIGGGGTVADYVGSYTGDVESVPDMGAASKVGTVSLAVAADGTVTGVRHLAAIGHDEALNGSIDGQGALDLSRPGGTVTGVVGIRGYFAKASDATVVAMLLDGPAVYETGNIDASETFAVYRLKGGSELAAPSPLTTGLWQNGYAQSPYRMRGHWSSGEASGDVSLAVSPTGRVSGSWTDANGKRSVTGLLYDAAIPAEKGYSGLIYSGTLTIGTQAVEMRLNALTHGTMIGLDEIVGTISTSDGRLQSAVCLRMVY